MQLIRFTSDQFDAVIDYFQVRPAALGEVDHLLEQALVLRGVAADRDAADERILPDILQIQLGGGDIELAPQPGQDGLDDAALLF